MTKVISGRTILCVWEMGGDLGHITRLSSITKALEKEGHRVVLALKDITRCYPIFKETQAQILQAPIWHLKLKMQRPIACLADALLLSGYLDPDALIMLVKAWQSIVQYVKPDVVIFDYSPTAHLALRDQRQIVKIIVGNGFSVPEAGYPIADWRNENVDDDLIARQEQVVLVPINKVLKELGISEITTLSDLWRVDKVILNEFPPFDPYQKIRKNTFYCLKQVSADNLPSIVFPNTGNRRIIAYLKPVYPKYEQVIKALASTDADVFVVSPLAPEKFLQSYVSERFNYSTRLVNLPDGLKQADLFVGHGNATTVKEALIAEIPSIVLPLQQEQLLIGKTLQKLGAGLLLVDFDNENSLSKQITLAMADDKLRKRVKIVKNSYQEKASIIADVVKDYIADILGK